MPGLCPAPCPPSHTSSLISSVLMLKEWAERDGVHIPRLGAHPCPFIASSCDVLLGLRWTETWTYSRLGHEACGGLRGWQEEEAIGRGCPLESLWPVSTTVLAAVRGKRRGPCLCFKCVPSEGRLWRQRQSAGPSWVQRAEVRQAF